jgi:acyl-CoA synthetase (AMP-forming)/AMP-acid ligase II
VTGDVAERARLQDYVRGYAAERGEQLALVSDGALWTYAQLAAAIDDYSHALTAAGVSAGDVVAVLAWSCPEAFILFLAASRIGALYLGLNPKQTLAELMYIVCDAKPRLVVGLAGEDEQTQKLRQLRDQANTVREVVTRHGDGVSTSLRQFIRAGRTARPAPDRSLDPDRPCAIVYTSGSTGLPKGALLSEAGMIRSAVMTWDSWYGSISPLRTVAQHPVNHVGWLVCECVGALVAGGTTFFKERFSGPGTLQLIERERLNLWVTLPSMVTLALESPEFEVSDLSSLERVALGSMLPVQALRRLRSRTRAVISVSYGLTEANGGALTVTDDDASLETIAESIGRPVRGVEVRIVGGDGRDVSDAEPGELLIRDRSLFLGYLGRPDETAHAIDSDGWLHTGDVATRRPDGNLRLVGRLKEMFRSGGYNVYPTEIEVVIGAHGAVRAVAVVEIPDPLWTEVGVAFVVAKAGHHVDEETLRAFARERLANYKVPKRFVFLDALPLLPNGKYDKVRMRSEAAALSPQRADTSRTGSSE